MAGQAENEPLGREAADAIADARRGEGAEDLMVPGTLGWVDWPEALTGWARQVMDALEAGRPASALNVLDEMINDLVARRRVLVDLANVKD